MDLKEQIIDIQRGIKAGQYPNEAAVSKGIVLRVLQLLNWNIFDPRIVYPEYPLDNLKVDYALCHPISKPTIIIEVKAIGKLEGADMQLLEYAFKAGVPMAIVTDGQQWQFYLPSGKGSMQERQFYKIDFIERDPDEIIKSLNRYLLFDSVKNGDAFKSARSDYDSVAVRREVRNNLPIAWQKIIEQQDSLLVDLISEKVADMCGYKPEIEEVSAFLKEQLRSNIPYPVVDTTETGVTTTPRYGLYYTIRSKTTNARSAKDVLIKVIEELSKQDKSFLQRFASRKHGTKRRYVAQQREDLYPGRPDLVKNCSEKLSSGWWVSTNYSKSNIEIIIRLACEVAGLEFGKDLIVNLG